MKKILIAGIAGIIIGGGIAFGGVQALSHTGIATSSNASANIMTQPADTISLVDAQSIALNKVPGAVITDFEYSNEGTPSYEATLVSGKTEYELDIDAKTGAITKFETETKDYKGTVTNANQGVIDNNKFISTDKAKEIALSKAPKAKIVGFSLDYENVTPQYDVELINSTTKYEIDINAKTGAILESSSEALPNVASTSNSSSAS